VFLWRGPVNAFAASGPEVDVSVAGRFDPGRALRIPPALSLLGPPRAADLPGELSLVATRGADRVAARFRPESSSEIRVPADADALGVTSIHECVGPAVVEATLGGEAVAFEGRGVFEFVRHTSQPAGSALEEAPPPERAAPRSMDALSTAAPGRAARLLRRAFAVLDEEAPSHAALLRAALSGLRLIIDVDGERLSPRADDGRLAIAAVTDEGAEVRIATSMAAAIALLDDRRTLLEALHAGELRAWGAARDLAHAGRVLSTFLHGLVRCPSAPALLTELRRAAMESSHPGDIR
jgi:hypothetical protein